MQTISIISLKGGVAKTTTAVNMAYILAAVHKKKVLVIDNDKQGNASKAFDRYDTEDKDTIARAMLERNFDVSEIIKKTNYEGIDIITANMDLLEANLKTVVDAGRQQQTRFKKALAAVSGNYDFCIIDNAPDINMSIINALVMTNDVIMPIFMDQYSFDGLNILLEQIAQVQEDFNETLNFAGCLVTQYQNNDVNNLNIEKLQARGLPMYTQKIRRTEKKVSESTFEKMPLVEYSVRCGAAQDYKKFAAGKISTSAANEIAGLEPDAQQALYETYKATGSLVAKDAKALKEVFPDDLPEELKAEVRQYAAETGISLEDAAGIIRERHERAQEPPKEPPKEAEAIENTPEPEKGQETAQDEPESSFMNEPETKVTYNAPMTDNTDRKSLIINGKINMHKEYNGMAVNYFMGAVIGSDLFGVEFWQGWKKCDSGNCASPRVLYLMDYAGTATTYTVQTDTTEKCKAVLTDTGLEVLRAAAGQTAVISYEELAELIDIMIYTKVIEIKTIESDMKYWAHWTAKELVAISNYLTETEIYVLQDLMMRCKERAGR